MLGPGWERSGQSGWPSLVLLCQDCLGSSKILSVFFLAVSLKTEAALNRHLDLGRMNTVATLQSPSKFLSLFVLVRLRGAAPAVLRPPGGVHPCTYPAYTVNSQTRVLTD